VLVRVETLINAPAERCFDLARSIDFHLYCARSTHEKVAGGVTSGLLSLHQEVEWRARHFFLWFSLRVRITEFVPPVFFQDSMVQGPFKSFRHGHSFKPKDSATEMIDEVTFESPFLRLNQRIARHLEEFLKDRNALLKTALESDQWRQYLPQQEN
jgi:ligand-binding SRPBCC domain-containing protein